MTWRLRDWLMMLLSTNGTCLIWMTRLKMKLNAQCISETLTYQIPEGVREYSYHGEAIGKKLFVDPPLTLEFVNGRALSAARRHHNAFLYDTSVNKRTAPADSSNCTTIASVGPRSKPLWLGVSPQSVSSLLSLSFVSRSLSLSLFFSGVFFFALYVYL